MITVERINDSFSICSHRENFDRDGNVCKGQGANRESMAETCNLNERSNAYTEFPPIQS